VHELKHDGYRLQIHVRDGRVRLYNMNAADWTKRYPQASPHPEIASCANSSSAAMALLLLSYTPICLSAASKARKPRPPVRQYAGGGRCDCRDANSWMESSCIH
jgi:hypothetical protein